MGELGESPKPLGGEQEIKDAAIKRHYNVVTTPGVSDEKHKRSLHALGILSRDTGKPIIVRLIDRLARTLKEKNKNDGKNIISSIPATKPKAVRR